MSYGTRWGKWKGAGRRLRQTPLRRLGLLVKTFLLLLMAKVALAVMPVNRIIGWKRRKIRPGGLDAEGQVERRREVRWAVLVVSRWSPVRFVCFPQCLAASELLAAEGIASRLHYGVRRGAETARLETHTWLEAGGEIVIGGEVAEGFSTLESY